MTDRYKKESAPLAKRTRSDFEDGKPLKSMEEDS